MKLHSLVISIGVVFALHNTILSGPPPRPQPQTASTQELQILNKTNAWLEITFIDTTGACALQPQMLAPYDPNDKSTVSTIPLDKCIVSALNIKNLEPIELGDTTTNFLPGTFSFTLTKGNSYQLEIGLKYATNSQKINYNYSLKMKNQFGVYVAIKGYE
jgi:hypothetical protein